MSTATGRLNWPFAATWAACTLISWLLAVAWADTNWSAAGTFLAGIFAQFVTLVLRWRLIEGRARQRPIAIFIDQSPTNWLQAAAASDHAVTWVLCWISQLHMVGIALLGSGFAVGLSLAASLAICELALLRFAPLEWNEWLPDGWPAAFRPYGFAGQAIEPWDEREHERAMEDDFAREPWSDEEADLESEFEAAKVSATFHGHADDGSAYLQGWQRYEMSPSQKNLTLTIGFFPPFFSPPDCELDHEGDDEVHYEIEHLTPAGARIVLKRRQAGEPTSGKLLWHCNAKNSA